MEERVSVVAGLSFTAYLLTSFVFWRRGLAGYGVGDARSWAYAVIGTALLIAFAFGAKPLLLYLMEEHDAGCLVLLVFYALALSAGYGYWRTIRAGGAPQWILNPASALTLFWDEPPRWATVASYVISILVGMLLAAGGRAGRRR